MTKKQRIKTLIILLLIVTLIITIFWGSPVKRYKVKSQLKDYVQERYGDHYYMSKFEFDMMHRTYHSNFTSLTNGEFTFYVGQDNVTGEIHDGYEYELEKLDKQLELQLN